MDTGEKSKVAEVLNRAFAGAIVDKRVVAAAIREYEELLDNVSNRSSNLELVTMKRKEVENMTGIIRFQDKKIQDLTDKVDRMSHADTPLRPLAAVKEDKDIQRRYDLADKFNSVFENEWKAAYSELARIPLGHLECIYSLMRVVRNACDLCITLAEEQLDKLCLSMEECMINPQNGNSGKLRELFQKHMHVYSDGMNVAEKYALEYRTERAQASVSNVIEVFMLTKLNTIINPGKLGRDFKRYIERVVELVWLMTSLEPPMRLYWQQQTEKINLDFFGFYEHRGELINQTVWPAVFMHNTGKLIYRGYVIAM